MMGLQTELKRDRSKNFLLEINNLSLIITRYDTGFIERKIQIFSDLNLTVKRGEIVAIVGASGSGKSLLAHSIIGLLPENAELRGELFFRGKPLTQVNQMNMRGKEIALIPQSVNALNPLLKIKDQIYPPHMKGKDPRTLYDYLRQMKLHPNVLEKYPFELSGGMARRVLVTTALLSDASLIIADEPTPGLDPTVLQETRKLLKKLAQTGKGVLLITHDIGTATTIAHKIAVFKQGKVIEQTEAQNFSKSGDKLKHPFTKALWKALPENKFCLKEDQRLETNEENLSQRKRTQNMLEVKNLSFRYEQNHPFIFENVDFTLREGEITGLYGPSGTGKSTFAKTISGYLTPEKGDVLINGKQNTWRKSNPIQLIWQHPEKSIHPKWTMNQVLKEANITDNKLIEQFGIRKDWLTRRPWELSSGELQRFCLVRALKESTQFIIADEITTMLDAINQAEIWTVLTDLIKERKIGMLVISHNHELLKRLSNRIIAFDKLSRK